MKKLSLLFALLLCCLIQVQAQQNPKIRAGIKAGANVSSWGGDAVESFANTLGVSGETLLATGTRTGFHLGGYLHVPVAEGFSLEPGLYYSTKGMQVEHTFNKEGFFRPQATITNVSHYLDLPVLAKVTLGEGFQLFGGPQMSYLMANKIRAEAGVFGFSYEQDIDWNKGFRKFDFALTGGVGYQFASGVQLSAAYDHGLTTLDDGRSNLDVYNRALKLSIGYTFK